MQITREDPCYICAKSQNLMQTRQEVILMTAFMTLNKIYSIIGETGVLQVTEHVY